MQTGYEIKIHFFFTTLVNPFFTENCKKVNLNLIYPGFVSVHLGNLAVEFEIRIKAKIPFYPFRLGRSHVGHARNLSLSNLEK